MPLSTSTFGSLGAGVSDIFQGFAAETKAKGDELEAQSYGEAAILAGQNAEYTEMSTGIQVAQKNRELLLSQGRTTAQVAGAGFALGGSGLDILRSSASQGALNKAVISQQGLITEAGYKEQQQSYLNMQQAAEDAAKAEKTSAIGSFIAGGLNLIGAGVGVFLPK